MSVEFKPFTKIPRLRRDCIITEKIDGTNASVYISEDGEIRAGSRTRWITPEDDNYGFAKWVAANREDLLKLGPGHHFGEWWGQKIQRGYGLTEKRFSLFHGHGIAAKPSCVSFVPVLYQGPFTEHAINTALDSLRVQGSFAVPFMDPEGIVIFHIASQQLFKVTLHNDEAPKGVAVGKAA